MGIQRPLSFNPKQWYHDWVGCKRCVFLLDPCVAITVIILGRIYIFTPMPSTPYTL
jgi:hypothetical protein